MNFSPWFYSLCDDSIQYRIFLVVLGLVCALGCGGGVQENTQSQGETRIQVSSSRSQEIVALEKGYDFGELEVIAEEQDVDAIVPENLNGTRVPFTISSPLCENNQGPVCIELKLGDDYLTTSSPANGYLYSCSEKNPNAPGSREDRITWINFRANTWNFLKKLWLPEGSFQPNVGTYDEMVIGDIREIEVNNLPVDGKIGDWPMNNYPTLSEIDGNPGIPLSREFSFSYPVKGEFASSPTCVDLGAIGVTMNGVLLFNAADARGEDAVAREVTDEFGGHPAREDYHYHFIPERLDNDFLDDGHSGIIGYINDGFPIYGYKGEKGLEMSNEDLDICHGHDHGTLGYHYHATIEYPYTVGCYRGMPTQNAFNLMSPQR
jgi:hypothetical protein